MPTLLPDFAGITGVLRGFGVTPAEFRAADDAMLVRRLMNRPGSGGGVDLTRG